MPKFPMRPLRAVAFSVGGFAAIALLAAAGAAVAQQAPSFPALLKVAQAEAPQIAEAEALQRQAEATARQAGVRLNPRASLQVENFAGGRPYEGFDRAETTASIGQTLELGGKRPARVAAAEAAIAAANARVTQARADHAFDLASAYVDAEVAGRRTALTEEALELAQEDERIARVLVETGREAEVRLVQASAATAEARANLESARADAAARLSLLAALSGAPAFTSIEGGLLASSRTATFDPSSSPRVLLAIAEREAAARRVTVEQTRMRPDLDVSLGVRRHSGDDATALVAGISAPIPVFDRNRSGVAAARAEEGALQARVMAARREVETAHAVARAEAAAESRRLAAALQAETAAAETYRLTRLGFEGGKLPMSEVVTARRAIIETRTRALEAQEARARALAALARLSGSTAFGERP